MKKNLIISIIIIIITFIFFYYFFSYSKQENFINPNDYYFLSKEETIIFINADEDNYIKNLSIYDLKARKVKTTNEYLDLISHSCMDFTQEQKEKLMKSASQASSYFNNGFKWKFALISSNYEEGFPHTRTDIIFLSPAIINYQNDELTKTLIHESIHIYQRFNKKEVNDYLKKYGFQISRKKGTDEKDKLIRSNPDLDEYIYMDNKGNEMIAYYNSEKPNGIGDIYLTNLSNEHPYEKIAYQIATRDLFSDIFKQLKSKADEKVVINMNFDPNACVTKLKYDDLENLFGWNGVNDMIKSQYFIDSPSSFSS